MIELLELAADLWVFGIPVVMLVWAVLRLAVRASGRTRYAIAVAGLLATIVAPLLISSLERNPAAITTAHPIGIDSASEPLGTAAVLAAIWIAGALLLLAREVRGHVRLARLRMGPAAPAELRRQLRWPDDVALYVGGAAPMTAGLMRPYVVVPAELLDVFDSRAARRIALHELAHARWRDPLVYAILRLATIAFWIGPVWPLLRWVRREREAAADDAALREDADREGYVEALLHVSRETIAHRDLLSAAAGSDLEHRICRIVMDRPSGHPIAAVAVLLLAVSMAAAAAPARYALPQLTAVTTAVLQSPAPAPAAEAVRSTPALARRRAPRVVVEALPGSRFVAANLEPAVVAEPPPLPIHVDRHVDVDRHVARDVHVTDPDKKVIRIRNVIRTTR
jgi:beta-lactamase regulating signal transducer with metallopeptidase domain